MELMNRWTKEPFCLTPCEASVMAALEEAGPQGLTMAMLAREGLGYANPYDELMQGRTRRTVADIRRKLGKGAIARTTRGYALGDVARTEVRGLRTEEVAG